MKASFTGCASCMFPEGKCELEAACGEALGLERMGKAPAGEHCSGETYSPFSRAASCLPNDFNLPRLGLGSDGVQ